MAVKSVTRTQVIPYIFYRDAPAALEWLSRAFGFTERMRTQTPQRRDAWGNAGRRPAHHDGTGPLGIAHAERQRHEGRDAARFRFRPRITFARKQRPRRPERPK